MEKDFSVQSSKFVWGGLCSLWMLSGKRYPCSLSLSDIVRKVTSLPRGRVSTRVNYFSIFTYPPSNNSEAFTLIINLDSDPISIFFFFFISVGIIICKRWMSNITWTFCSFKLKYSLFLRDYIYIYKVKIHG